MGLSTSWDRRKNHSLGKRKWTVVSRHQHVGMPREALPQQWGQLHDHGAQLHRQCPAPRGAGQALSPGLSIGQPRTWPQSAFGDISKKNVAA